MLDVTDAVKAAIMSGNAGHIAAAAGAAGCEPLRVAAVRRAVAGVTSLEEALRVTAAV